MKCLLFLAHLLVFTACAAAADGARPLSIEIPLVIVRHEDVPIDDSIVRAIVDSATEALEKRHGGDDTECPVRFRVAAQVRVAGRGKLPYTIDGPVKFFQMQFVPGDIKIVGHINWCGVYEPSYWGCAGPVNGAMAVVAIRDAAAAGVLWAHEFGHCAGLGHAGGLNAKRLMLPAIRSDNRVVQAPECRKVLAAGACTAKEMRARASHAQRIAVAPKDFTPLPPVEKAVNRYWVHGIPYPLAQRYGKKDGQRLAGMLKDPAAGDFVVNAVTFLGMMGDDRHAKDLIEYHRAGTGELDPAQARAKRAVPIALGMIANRTGSKTALEYLRGLSGRSAPALRWALPRRADFQARDITSDAVIGLALSGSEQADDLLEKLQSAAAGGAPALDVRTAEQREWIEQLRRVRVRVKDDLAGYLGTPRIPITEEK